MTRPAAWDLLHLVLVSPSDVAAERAEAVRVVDAINVDVLHQDGVHMEVHRWEEDAYPALHGKGPQTHIEERLDIENSQLVVAILWGRIGTETANGETGTERELRKAWQAWESTGQPQVLMYACKRPLELSTSEETLQRYKVQRLLERTKGEQKQFVYEYSDVGDFTAELRKHLLAIRPTLSRTSPPSPLPPVTPAYYLDEAAGSVQPDRDVVEAFRRDMRPELVGAADGDGHLSQFKFLHSLGVILPDGRLTRTGALLFSADPSVVLPTALVQCVHFDGVSLSAPRRNAEFRGPATQQIKGVLDFISEATTFESPSGRSGESEARPPFPMVCLREVIANAIAHRDYEDNRRTVNVRLFSDRVEVASPGLPLNCELDSPSPLQRLSSESVKRNFTLARLLTYVKLMEGSGSGIPTAVEDARTAGVPEPTAKADAGHTTVTVFRRRDEEVEFADRRVATPLARYSLNLIVHAPRPAPAKELTPRDTFGFNPDFRLVFYVPTLQRDPALSWRMAVTAEDVLATRSVIQALLDRWPQVDVDTMIVEPETTWPGEATNVCSICREGRNPVTTALLAEFRRTTGTQLGFVPMKRDRAGSPTEWGIAMPNGQVQSSPSYGQERGLTQVPSPVDTIVELEDVALIARFRNSLDPSHQTSALVVAGARAFGTWGAAEYFRSAFDELEGMAGERDFASMLRVRCRYRVSTVEVAQILLFPTDDGSPAVEPIDFVLLS